jgi:hypothetical protein
LVQQHYNGTTFFERTWNEFKAGFGSISGNYWIGNEQLYQLTKNGQYRLRVDLQAKLDCQWYWAEYSTFVVGNEASFYRLTIGGYTGTAGDVMVTINPSYWSLNGAGFTTKDSDHDSFSSNCAITPAAGYTACPGGFWYNDCGGAMINNPQGCIPGFAWWSVPGKLLVYSRLTLI